MFVTKLSLYFHAEVSNSFLGAKCVRQLEVSTSSASRRETASDGLVRTAGGFVKTASAFLHHSTSRRSARASASSTWPVCRLTTKSRRRGCVSCVDHAVSRANEDQDADGAGISSARRCGKPTWLPCRPTRHRVSEEMNFYLSHHAMISR